MPSRKLLPWWHSLFFVPMFRWLLLPRWLVQCHSTHLLSWLLLPRGLVHCHPIRLFRGQLLPRGFVHCHPICLFRRLLLPSGLIQSSTPVFRGLLLSAGLVHEQPRRCVFCWLLLPRWLVQCHATSMSHWFILPISGNDFGITLHSWLPLQHYRIVVAFWQWHL